jgi:hypothetical protein
VNDQEVEYNRTTIYMVARTMSFWKDNLDENKDYIVRFLSPEPKRLTMAAVDLIGTNPQFGAVNSGSECVLSVPSV